jgi:hypothetical protein
MALYGSGDTVTVPDRFELVKDLKKMQTICWNLHMDGATNNEDSASREQHIVWVKTISNILLSFGKK